MVKVRLYLNDKSSDSPLDVELAELPKVGTNIFHCSREDKMLVPTAGEYKIQQVLPCVNVSEDGSVDVMYLVRCELDKADY